MAEQYFTKLAIQVMSLLLRHTFSSVFTLQYTAARPEVVGADQKPPSTDSCTSDIGELAFDVRKYKQTVPQVQSHASLVSNFTI